VLAKAVLDVLRSATQPLTTREITEQLLVVRDQTSIAEQLPQINLPEMREKTGASGGLG